MVAGTFGLGYFGGEDVAEVNMNAALRHVIFVVVHQFGSYVSGMNRQTEAGGVLSNYSSHRTHPWQAPPTRSSSLQSERQDQTCRYGKS